MKTLQNIKNNNSKIKTLKPSLFWEINKPLSPKFNWLLMTISLITPLLSWWLISGFTNIDSIFLPSPLEVGKALISLGEKGYLQQDTLYKIRLIAHTKNIKQATNKSSSNHLFFLFD